MQLKQKTSKQTLQAQPRYFIYFMNYYKCLKRQKANHLFIMNSLNKQVALGCSECFCDARPEQV